MYIYISNIYLYKNIGPYKDLYFYRRSIYIIVHALCAERMHMYVKNKIIFHVKKDQYIANI